MMHRSNPSSNGFEMDEPVVSLGGVRNAEALRVIKTASQVNYVQIAGATASSAGGVQIQAQGSDTNIPLTLASKGSGATFVGGPAGGEALRVSRVSSQVNAIEVTGAATGSNPSIQARGADANRFAADAQGNREVALRHA